MTFDRQGPQNTEATLKLAMEAAREEGIHKIVVASYSGETALKLAELEHEGIRLICVARARGKTGRPDGNLSGAMRQELEARGVTICTAAHALSGAERGLSSQLGGFGPVEVAAHALRILGQGMKVGVEISLMAMDNGAVPYGEEILAVGGCGHGADYVISLIPGHSNNLFETKVIDIICKPRIS